MANARRKSKRLAYKRKGKTARARRHNRRNPQQKVRTWIGWP